MAVTAAGGAQLGIVLGGGEATSCFLMSTSHMNASGRAGAAAASGGAVEAWAAAAACASCVRTSLMGADVGAGTGKLTCTLQYLRDTIIYFQVFTLLMNADMLVKL